MSLDKKEAQLESDIESIDESGEINRPFDPNEIKISTQQLTIQHLIERLEFNEINLYTEFQRQHNLWNEEKQSRLIESILLNMPLPSFYFDGERDNNWQVVDGLQRVSTIKNFVVDKMLTLEGMEFLKQFNGKKYEDLSRDLQRRIKSFPITAYIIQEGTPDDVKYILFSRINTAGLVLSSAEIRHALNQGQPANFLKELAQLEVFKKAVDGSIKSNRMEDRDFVNRFVAFYIIGYENYEHDLNSFMNMGMAALKNKTRTELDAIKVVFVKANELAFQIFQNDAYRKRVVDTDRRRPINKALFDSLSVNLAKLTQKQVEKVRKKKDLVRDKLILLMRNDSSFWDSISSGTGQKAKVRTRFEKIKNILKETINS